MSRRLEEKHFLWSRIGQHGGCPGGVMESSQLLSWFNFYVGNLIVISKFITLGRSLKWTSCGVMSKEFLLFLVDVLLACKF